MIGENELNTLSQINLYGTNKPIVIYSFINPFCKECWLLEPIIKKLALEYGNFFTVRPIISIHPIFEDVKISSNKNYLKQYVALAIKAAGLQGNKAGRQFLEKIQVAHFHYDDDLLNKNVIMNYASLVNLDLEEFSNDLFSNSAKKAYLADLKLTKEMNISEFPSLVFFSKHNEEHTLKITGKADYNAYVDLLYKLLNDIPEPQAKPEVELFLKEQGLLSIEDIAFIYDWSLHETNKILNKLKLKGQVKELNILSRKYWSYNIKK